MPMYVHILYVYIRLYKNKGDIKSSMVNPCGCDLTVTRCATYRMWSDRFEVGALRVALKGCFTEK